LYDGKGDLHKSDLCATHVDLPDIELLVVVDAFVHLVGFKALGGAAIHDVADLDRLSRACELTDDGENAIRSVGNTKKKKENIFVRMRDY